MTSNHFLQSKEWEEFQKSLGRKTWRVEGVLVIKLPLIFGKSYLYSAGNEIPPSIDEIKNSAKKESAVFLKYESMIPKVTGFDPVTFGFRRSNKEIQPQSTIILDITKSEEELLGGMHKKTRYNINLAQKKDLKFSIADADRLEEFWDILQKTKDRDSFNTHDIEYYEKLLEVPFIRLLGVEHKDKFVAVSIVAFYDKTATYLHGASDYDYRDLMAPYLLHWESIKHAKDMNFEKYDLWGVDEKKWPGVTRFKKGFGGGEVEYVGSYDYIFSGFWYKLYTLRSLIKSIVKI